MIWVPKPSWHDPSIDPTAFSLVHNERQEMVNTIWKFMQMREGNKALMTRKERAAQTQTFAIVSGIKRLNDRVTELSQKDNRTPAENAEIQSLAKEVDSFLKSVQNNLVPNPSSSADLYTSIVRGTEKLSQAKTSFPQSTVLNGPHWGTIRKK
jgi:hypothetical protein